MRVSISYIHSSTNTNTNTQNKLEQQIILAAKSKERSNCSRWILLPIISLLMDSVANLKSEELSRGGGGSLVLEWPFVLSSLSLVGWLICDVLRFHAWLTWQGSKRARGSS